MHKMLKLAGVIGLIIGGMSAVFAPKSPAKMRSKYNCFFTPAQRAELAELEAKIELLEDVMITMKTETSSPLNQQIYEQLTACKNQRKRIYDRIRKKEYADKQKRLERDLLDRARMTTSFFMQPWQVEEPKVKRLSLGER